MTIRIILENNQTAESLKEVSMIGNEKILFQEGYSLLGSLDSFSYDVFESEQMEKLICEIQAVRANLDDPASLKHVDEIISLAKECMINRELVLAFTPFSISDERSNR